MIRLIAVLLVLALSAAAAAAAERMTIGYVDRIDDPRHEDRVGFGGILLEQRGRAFDGAKLAIDDLAMVGRSLGIEIELVEARAESAEAIAGEVDKLRRERGARFILIDAPADALTAAARGTRDALSVQRFGRRRRAAGRGVPSAHDAPDAEPCHASDALVQFVVARKWRDILVLEGPDAQDAESVRALERSAKRFGARIVAKRPFVLGSDPRERDQNNLALLTGGAGYDVVFIADESREVARFLPYQTLSPRPVIGSAGLTAEAWHWAWDRDGGANLSRRFRRMAQRPMRGEDWAAWIGVKAIIEAVLRVAHGRFRQSRGPSQERGFPRRRLQGPGADLPAVGQPASPADPACHHGRRDRAGALPAIPAPDREPRHARRRPAGQRLPHGRVARP